MSGIMLTAEQWDAIANVKGRIPVCRPDGNVVGLFAPYSMPATPFTPEEIAEAERQADDPNTRCYTTKEVLEHLRSLENG
jgi:hypothetical protein